MSNFFLLNETIVLEDFDSFKQGMAELTAIKKDQEDVFLKHESIYNLSVYEQLCLNYGGFVEKAISLFIEQLTMQQTYINSEEEFDALYPDMTNAFLGIDFSKTSINISKQISNTILYEKFNTANLWNVTFRNFWSKKEKLFPSLILCGDVKEQIARIGNSSQFNQIVDRLREFNEACSEWKSGEFNYKEINKKYALRISPESSQTMSKYGSERKFPLPYGGTEYFELHIKAGDFRFHFFPNINKTKVYVGYIGPHLHTVNN